MADRLHNTINETLTGFVSGFNPLSPQFTQVFGMLAPFCNLLEARRSVKTSHICFFIVNHYGFNLLLIEGDQLMTKASVQQNPVREMKADAKRAAKQAAFSPLMERLARLGYGVKGFLYIAIGFISIAGALGKSSTPADQLGAIVAFSKLPYAELLIWIILIGLISYSIWGVIRAVLDPFHKGTDLKGLLSRGGYLISAATYASFALPTNHLITGARGGTGANGTAQMVAKVMNMPMGRWLVAAIGVAAIAAGLYQIYMGYKMDFDKEFKPYALTPDQLRIAKQLGRFGTMARGLVFALVGWFVTLAAYQANANHAQGFDGALDYLGKQPYGMWLLGIVALGLIAFGIYSVMSAAWLKLKR
jgi:hypothetical protein